MRHLDGWQAGAITLLLAGSAILLAVPRDVPPTEVPLPVVDQKALGKTMAQDDALACAAEKTALDVDIRAVGRELRTYNHASLGADPQEFVRARGRVIEATTRALMRSETDLLKLRAYQLRIFVAELEKWTRTGVYTDELKEQGGDFFKMLQNNHWCFDGGRRLPMDERVLRVFFKKRWNDVTGVAAASFALSLDEDRARFGFLLRFPGEPKDERRRRLDTIERLSSRDPSYPAHLARGVMFYRMQRFRLAADAFRIHLEKRADGPYTLRAQNYLKASLERIREGLF